MKPSSRIPCIAIALAFAAGAYGQQSRFASFEMSWPAQAEQDVLARAQTAAEIITGQKIANPESIPTTGGSVQMRVAEKPNLEIAYLARHGEFRIVDRGLEADIASAREMTQEEAVKLAKRTFDQLAAANLVNQRQYDWTKANVGSTWVGGGVRGAASSEKKRIEYRITVRRNINGIELANAGVRIAVHTSGRIASVRLGGVNVASRVINGVEEPTGQGRWLTPRAGLDLRGRLQGRIPGAGANTKSNMKIVWERVMYVMPENKQAAVVEPLYVVSYSLVVPTDGDQPVVSRRKMVGLSLVNPNAEPIDLTPADSTPEIDTRLKPAI